MEETHVTREILQAAARGELPPRVLTDLGLRHLMALCPVCRREIEAFQGKGTPDSPHYLSVLQTVLQQHEPRLATEERGARLDFKRLMALPRAARAQAVIRARTHFRSGAFIRLLLRKSEEHIHTDPREAFHVAELARIAAQHSPALPDVFELVVLTSAAMGNAQRAAGLLRNAEPFFQYARALVQGGLGAETAVLARLDELEGSLRKDQRLFARAQELFSRAVTLYRLDGAHREQTRVLVCLGENYALQGKTEKALSTVRAALRRLPREPSRLYLCARYNLARYLVEVKQFGEAEKVLERDRDLHARFPEPWTQLRLTWLTGKIAAGHGNLEQAEELFRAARDGFLQQGIGYDAAMVVVEDLALLYLSQGETGAVKQLAEEASAIFATQDVHREAIAALLLFQEAARQETLTRKFIHELATYLKTTRHDPSCPFTPA